MRKRGETLVDGLNILPSLLHTPAVSSLRIRASRCILSTIYTGAWRCSVTHFHIDMCQVSLLLCEVSQAPEMPRKGNIVLQLTLVIVSRHQPSVMPGIIPDHLFYSWPYIHLCQG